MASADKGLEEIPEGSPLTNGFDSTGFLANADTHVTGQIESNYDETIDSFDAMSLNPQLLRGVWDYAPLDGVARSSD